MILILRFRFEKSQPAATWCIINHQTLSGQCQLLELSSPRPLVSVDHDLYDHITDNMRVIGGTHRGRRLRTVTGLTVRPTSDRLRETLFNVLAPRITGSRFLDICSGSGAVGIEALSRGAMTATFVERSREACAVIEANLNSLGIGKEAIVINRDALTALKRLEQGSTQFDLAFFDPPYTSEIYGQVMRLLGSGILISAAGLVIVEHRAKSPPEPLYGKLRLSRELKQGESALAFYETKAGEIR